MSRRCLNSVDTFVLAGGLGTRIRPVLGGLPKLLAPIAGRPYLSHLLDWLASFGARRVVLGLGHQASIIIEQLISFPVDEIDIATIVEPRPLGTAGAIRFARDALHSDPVLTINGDSLVDADLCQFLEHHRAARTVGSILCAQVEDAGRYGRVEIDRAGRIRGFIEKDPTFPGSALVNAGIYLLSASLLDEIASREAVSLERDVFERLPPGSLSAFTGPFRFIDIGTPESLARADGVFSAIDWAERVYSRK